MTFRRSTLLASAALLVAACGGGKEEIQPGGAVAASSSSGQGTGGDGGSGGAGPSTTTGGEGGEGSPSSTTATSGGGEGGAGGDGGGGAGGGDGGAGGGQVVCDDPPCDTGEPCVVAEDCVNGVCAEDGLCAEPTCTDEVFNGGETSVDCGGPCPPCAGGSGCLVDEDCESFICDEDLVCDTATCRDGVLNAEETDIDCGGSCFDCGAGKACAVADDCVSGVCTNDVCACPTGMAVVPTPGGGSYCIDATEVTYAEYDAFITSSPVNTLPECLAFNLTFVPSALWPPTTTEANPNYLRKPVRYVDWCDASRYCATYNKRLCGSVDGGPVTSGSLDDPDEDRWFNACSAQGNNLYPYGDEYAATCTESVAAERTQPENVRTANGALITTCLGGVSGVHQMSGNVAEWEDSCDDAAGGDDQCVIRGGSYLTDVEEELQCSSINRVSRSTTAPDIGFRCCQ
jgi:hypothetical protein